MQVYLAGDYVLFIELNERMSSVGFYCKSKKSLIPSKGLVIPKLINKNRFQSFLQTPNNYPKNLLPRMNVKGKLLENPWLTEGSIRPVV